MNIPYLPKSFHGDVPQYSAWEIDIFGPPHNYGIEEYFVLDSKVFDENRVMTSTDYDRPHRNTRPKHEYCREQRFKSTLRQLLGGCRDSIPFEIINCFDNGVVNWDRKHVWNSVWQQLKKKKFVSCEQKDDTMKLIPTARYYNRIPEILIDRGYKYRIKLPNIDYEEMYRYFKRMHFLFNQYAESHLEHRKWHKKESNNNKETIASCPHCQTRVYFPNLRYIILKMLLKAGTEFEYNIPILRTKRKIPELDAVWDELTSEIDIIYF